jgi:menaquinone-specific isochorismate synthase
MKINSDKISNDFFTFIKSLENFNNPKLISFAFHLEQFDALPAIDKLNEFSDDIFLFRTPNKYLTVYGLNSALELTSKKTTKFASVTDNYTYWEKNCVTNWSEKQILSKYILCCSAKFDPLNVATDWIDFEPLRIYVPEFLFEFKDDDVSGFYNFVIDNKSKFDIISSNLLSFLRKLSTISGNLIQHSNHKTSVQLTSENNELEKWNVLTNKVMNELDSGKIEKLVLSRAYIFKLNATIIWSSLLDELFKRFPECYLFFIKKKDSIFFGSSPEMFLKVAGNIAEVESVAGSAARGEESESDDELEKSLRTSEKNHQEHLFVSNFISDILIKYSNKVRIIEEKQIRKLDNIQHLITRISAELSSKENLFKLFDSLFPTPAVCGVPKESAMNLIREIESHNRGLYSGLVGLLDFENNCELAVSIRSALVRKKQVTAFAGAGLVKNSDPHEEYLETNLKLNTILSLFTNEDKSK